MKAKLQLVTWRTHPSYPGSWQPWRRLSGSRADPRVLGVEDRGGADDVDRDRVLLTHVLDRECGTHDCLLGRQVGHEDVLAHGRRCTGARHVGTAALGVDERHAVACEDRLPPPPGN